MVSATNGEFTNIYRFLLQEKKLKVPMRHTVAFCNFFFSDFERSASRCCVSFKGPYIRDVAFFSYFLSPPHVAIFYFYSLVNVNKILTAPPSQIADVFYGQPQWCTSWPRFSLVLFHSIEFDQKRKNAFFPLP